MATKAQIDAGVAILVAALDLKDPSGKNISQYNGQVVPAWNTLASSVNTALLPLPRDLGIDPATIVTPLT